MKALSRGSGSVGLLHSPAFSKADRRLEEARGVVYRSGSFSGVLRGEVPRLFTGEQNFFCGVEACIYSNNKASGHA